MHYNSLARRSGSEKVNEREDLKYELMCKITGTCFVPVNQNFYHKYHKHSVMNLDPDERIPG